MQLTLVTLGLAAMAMAIPAPMPLPTQAAEIHERRQVGGGLGGSVASGPSGALSGVVGSSTLAGCIGGVLPNGLGETICFPEATAKPKQRRQVGGGLGGSVSSGPSGALSGVVGSSTLAGCIGGVLPNGLGETICFPGATAKPKPRDAEPEAQVGGALGGSIGPGSSGTLSGEVGSSTAGLIGGVFGGSGETVSFPFPTALAVRDPEAEAQVGGSLGGSIGPGSSGTLSGEVGSTTAGLLGGVFGGSGETVYFPAPTAFAKREAEPQVGGGLGGSVSSGPSGALSGVAGSSTLAGCIGGVLPNGLGATLCGRAAEPTAYTLTRSHCLTKVK